MLSPKMENLSKILMVSPKSDHPTPDNVGRKTKLTGIAAHSQLCCQGQVDEPFHLSGIGGKILDSGQQHGEQRQQAFFVMTATYEM